MAVETHTPLDAARIKLDFPILGKPVHGKQLLTYLRLTKQPLGLLLNFGASTFREGVKRVVNGHTNFASSRLRVHQAAS